MALAVIALVVGLDAGAAEAMTPVATLNFNNGYTAYFGNNIAANSAFNDYFSFAIPSYAAGSGATNTIAGINISVNGIAPNVRLSNFELDSVNAQGGLTLVSMGVLGPLTVGTTSYPNTIATMSFSGLSQGITYALNVAGTSNSPLGGSYSGNIALNVPGGPTIISPVPEPGEMGLLLAGFGVISFVARRFKHQAIA